MRTASAKIAAVLCSVPVIKAWFEEEFAGAKRIVNGHEVLDLDFLNEKYGDEWVALIEAYDTKCREVTALRTAGEPVRHKLDLARLLALHQQVAQKGIQRDLSAEYEALIQIGALADFTELLLEPIGSPGREEALIALGTDLSAEILVVADTTVATIVVEGVKDWPNILGGPVSDEEARRQFTFHVDHRPGLDPKIRRLTRVEISAVEVWPYPSTCAAQMARLAYHLKDLTGTPLNPATQGKKKTKK
jgi:hypothetical protein